MVILLHIHIQFYSICYSTAVSPLPHQAAGILSENHLTVCIQSALSSLCLSSVCLLLN